MVNETSPQTTIRCPRACTAAGGKVWGTGVYTSGSPVCLAAIHAGVLTTGGGTATLYVQPGQPAYRGSTSNGVQSQSYGEWAASFSFEPKPAGLAPPGAGEGWGW